MECELGNWFRDRCNQAGLKRCSAHGVRKAGATIAAEQGATSDQLMAIFGWKKIAQAEVYTKAAEQKCMAGQAMRSLVLPGTDLEQKVPLDGLVEESGAIRPKNFEQSIGF